MTTSEQPVLRLERTFDATPEELWNAWTDPEQYAKWLNPAPGLDLVIHEYDVRPGGRIRFDMPQPDGNPHPQDGVFHELEPFRRIVTGSPDKSFLLRVNFEPDGARTRLIVEATGVPPEFHEPATAGWGSCFDKLGAELARGSVAALRLERTFDAPIEAVWAAWTTPEDFAQWFGPMAAPTDVEALDVRPGGTFRAAMRDASGAAHPIWGGYLVVEAPTELAFTACAAEIGAHVSTVRVRFERDGARTRMRLEQVGLPVGVAKETGEGWEGSWEKLAALLKRKAGA